MRNTQNTICPRSSDLFYIVGYYIKRVTASGTYSRKMSLSQGTLYFVKKKTENSSNEALNSNLSFFKYIINAFMCKNYKKNKYLNLIYANRYEEPQK